MEYRIAQITANTVCGMLRGEMAEWLETLEGGDLVVAQHDGALFRITMELVERSTDPQAKRRQLIKKAVGEVEILQPFFGGKERGE